MHRESDKFNWNLYILSISFFVNRYILECGGSAALVLDYEYKLQVIAKIFDKERMTLKNIQGKEKKRQKHRAKQGIPRSSHYSAKKKNSLGKSPPNNQQIKHTTHGIKR